MHKKNTIYPAALLSMLWMHPIAAQEENPPKAKESQKLKDPIVQEEGPTNLKLPGITIDQKKLEVTVDAVCCLDAGLLEYAICKPGTFEHEALFTTTARPELIHAALLLCKLQINPQNHRFPELWLIDALKKKESRLQIEVEWEEDQKKNRRSLSSLMRTRQGDEPDSPDQAKAEPKQAKDAWVFCGSFIHKPENGGQNTYAANISGVIVGIWPDPTAVIQYGVESENPYGPSGGGYEINESVMPKLGTPVKLIFICKAPEEKAAAANQAPNEKKSDASTPKAETPPAEAK